LVAVDGYDADAVGGEVRVGEVKAVAFFGGAFAEVDAQAVACLPTIIASHRRCRRGICANRRADFGG